MRSVSFGHLGGMGSHQAATYSDISFNKITLHVVWKVQVVMPKQRQEDQLRCYCSGSGEE